MKLLELRVEEFGRLQNRTFAPGEGLTLIEGPNESGKSTLLAFLRFMFYGFPRRGGGDEGEEWAKRLSWATHRAAGSLTVENAAGERFRITRSYVMRGSTGRENPFETTSVIALPGGAEVPLDGKQPGEYLMGLPQELYMSSLCVGQSDAARVEKPGVRKTVGELLFSGESSFSAENAEKALDATRRELQHKTGRGGRIAELEDRCAEVAERLRRARVNHEKLQEARAALRRYREKATELRQEIAKVDAALGHAETARTLARFAEWHRAEEDAARARDALDNLRTLHHDQTWMDEESARRLRADVRDLLRVKEEMAAIAPNVEQLRAARPDEQKLAAAEAIRAHGGVDGMCAFLKKFSHRCRALVLTALAVLAAGVACGALGALLPAAPQLPLFAGAGVGAAVGVILLAAAIHAKKAQKRHLRALGVKKHAMLRTYLVQCLEEETQNAAREQHIAGAETTLNEMRREHDRLSHTVNDALALYGGAAFTSPDEALEQIETLAARSAEVLAQLAGAQREVARADGAAQALRAPLEGLNEAALRAQYAAVTDTTEDPDTLRRWRAQLVSEAAGVDTMCENAARSESGYASVTEDPAALESEWTALNAQKAEAEQKLAAIDLAQRALKEAADDLRNGVVPRLAEDASGIFARLTGNAYAGLRVDTDFAISLDAAGNTLPLSRFSAGCRDAAHLALRLALLRTISEEQLPLMMDEALARLDDTRARALLGVLERYCEEGGQCLLFTCHTREGAWLEETGAPVARIAL